uniref:NADH-ubiquinone oxidoreductase chain 2 n=1 Tax=Clibanarius infraspinatus TaxID=1566627 RepID=A0A0A1IXY8_9EUCA|nr:NADH dehydrogenase subunit 2 [Clibanarius infraspinatus]CEH27539.1 NADH dehydrogenase subunit 2 [Clibanarius infraspinatus]
MYFTYSNMLFLSTLITGTLISISSTSWFSAWVGLELNLLSFIPMMITKNNQYSSEAALKYFLIQALGSSLIIFSSSFSLVYFNITNIVLFFALILKLGGAPFHFWLPQIMSGLLWPQIMMIMTIQKVAPLFLISYLMPSTHLTLYVFTVSSLSALIGGVGGINQTHLRKILAFSSINHMGWLLSALLISETLMMVYFVFYCFISLSIIILLQVKQTFLFNQILNFDMPNETKLLMFMSLLSLGGLPPFTGFIPKWIVIQELSTKGDFLLLLILLGSSLLTLYYYLRISTMFFTISSHKILISTKSKQIPKWFFSYFIYFNFIGILIPIIFLIV